MAHPDYPWWPAGTNARVTSADRHGVDSPDPVVAGTTAVAPAGSHAVVVHSDLRCPWAHVAVHRLLRAAEGLGVERELGLDHRWFPLDDPLPTDAVALDRMLAPVQAVEPGAGWRSWADEDTVPAGSARLAAAWVQAAKAQSPAASMALDRAFRQALFADHRDLDDPSTVADVAAAVDEVDLEAAAAEVRSGRPDAELDRHAQVSTSDGLALVEMRTYREFFGQGDERTFVVALRGYECQLQAGGHPAEGWRCPPCVIPEHAAGRVVRAGLYGKRPHQRQRWKCVPANGDPPHRFADVLPRQRAKIHACLECETHLEPWEGQQVARRYDFTTREIARSLIRVA